MVRMLRRRENADDTASGRGGTRRSRRSWNDGLFYELQLNGPAPDRINFAIDDPYRAKPDKAQFLVEAYQKERDARTAEGLATVSLGPVWQEMPETTALYRYLQTFAWLRDLSALGEEGREVAVALTTGWLDLYGRYSPEVWATDLVAERLWQFARKGAWLLEGSEALWRSALLTALARQTRHLSKAVSRIEHPAERLFSALSLSAMGLALPHHEACEVQGSTLLRRELRLQLRADGGHVSRNPSCQLDLTLRLQGLVMAYRALDREPPGFLVHAVGRTTDMTEFFRCGDGRLAVFNGGMEDDPKALTAALSFDNTGRSRVDFATQSGYQRLSSARSFVFVDMGQPSRDRAAQRTGNRYMERASGIYDGAFSFQFSTGRQRLVVNCGSGLALADGPENLDDAALLDWRQALAGPDAHSTLCVAGEEASPPARMEEAVRPVYHRLDEDKLGQLLELERFNVAGAPGATHRRRLFLGIDGDDLRGEDVLIPPSGEASPDWLLRFHLHPSIRASLSRDGRSVILATPKSEGWKFIAGNARIDLEKSLYCGVAGPLQPAGQIVVRPEKAQGTIRQVKWSFKRT